MEDVVLCFIYYPHSDYVAVFSIVYRFWKRISVLFQNGTYLEQNLFSSEWVLL
jgi:hypothetical protein